MNDLLIIWFSLFVCCSCQWRISICLSNGCSNPQKPHRPGAVSCMDRSSCRIGCLVPHMIRPCVHGTVEVKCLCCCRLTFPLPVSQSEEKCLSCSQMNTKEELPPPASEEKEGGLGLTDEYTSFTFFFYMGNITSHWRFGF